MKYRVHVRTYIDSCRPYEWQSHALYDIGEAQLFAMGVRTDGRSEAWLVPV